MFNRPTEQDSGGFDIVIGNPPYIDSETMTRLYPEIRNYCSTKYESAKGNWDIYILFFELALKCQNKKGTTAFVVPNKIVSIDYADAIRKYIAKHAYFISLVDYSRVSVFSEASVYPCILIITKAETKNLTISKMKGIDSVLYSNVIENNIFYSHNSWNYWLGSSVEINLLSKLIKQNNFFVKDKFNVSASATVNEAYLAKEIISDDLEFTSKTFKFINSGTIDKYLSLWGIKKTRYIKCAYNKPLIRKIDVKKVIPNRLNLTTSEKLIVASMTKVLEVFYDDGNYVAGKSTTCITSKDNGFSLKFLLGILNSKLESFWLIKNYNAQAMSGEAINISTSVVENLPIPPATPEQQQEIVALVEKILAAKASDHNADTSEWEKQIDKLVYALYNLTEEEIKIVEEQK